MGLGPDPYVAESRSDSDVLEHVQPAGHQAGYLCYAAVIRYVTPYLQTVHGHQAADPPNRLESSLVDVPIPVGHTTNRPPPS